MRVLFIVTLLTLSCAQEHLFIKLRKHLVELTSANDLTIVNGTQLKPLPDAHHACDCEEVFVKNLKESLKLVRSNSDYLRNSLDILHHHDQSKTTTKPEVKCETKPKKKRSTRRQIKVYLNSSITFIQAWNRMDCQKKPHKQ